MYTKKKTIRTLNFNYKLIKYYEFVNLFNNEIKINRFNRLVYILRSQNNSKNNKFFSKCKANIFSINNKKRLRK